MLSKFRCLWSGHEWQTSYWWTEVFSGAYVWCGRCDTTSIKPHAKTAKLRLAQRP